MIIKYKDTHCDTLYESLRNSLEEFITLSVNFHNDIYEKDLYALLLSEQAKGQTIDISPEVNLYKPRPNVGWKWSTLKYLASSDDYSLFLPEPEMLASKSGVKDVDKFNPEEDCIKIEKTELLRELKQLDIQLSKLIKKVEGGTY